MFQNRAPVIYQANQTSFSISNQSSPQHEPYFKIEKQQLKQNLNLSQEEQSSQEQNLQQKDISEKQSNNSDEESKLQRAKEQQSQKSQSEEDNSIDHLQQRIRKLQLTLSGVSNTKKNQNTKFGLGLAQAQPKNKIGWYKNQLDKENHDNNAKININSTKKVAPKEIKTQKNVKKTQNNNMIIQGKQKQGHPKQNKKKTTNSCSKNSSCSNIFKKKQSTIKTERSLSNTVRSRVSTFSKVKDSQTRQTQGNRVNIKFQLLQKQISDLKHENKQLKNQIVKKLKSTNKKKSSYQQKLHKQMELLQVLDTLHAKLSKSISLKQNL